MSGFRGTTLGRVTPGFAPAALGMEVPVLTVADHLDEHLGRLVAVRGPISDSKIPLIAGVEVKADDELRGQGAYAIGILTKWKVTEEELRKAEDHAGGPPPNDGPGTRYILYFDLAGRIAKARPLPEEFAAAGGSRPRASATVRVGQDFAAAEASARDAGYVLNDASQLAMAGQPGGFYLDLPGDRGLIVLRGDDGNVESVDLCEQWSRPKAARVYRSVESFDIPPAPRE